MGLVHVRLRPTVPHASVHSATGADHRMCAAIDGIAAQLARSGAAESAIDLEGPRALREAAPSTSLLLHGRSELPRE